MAIVHGGRIELTVPNDGPEGLRVEVTPLLRQIGLDEANYPTTPDGIQQLISEMDETAASVPPVDFDFDTVANDEFQKEAVRASWLESLATTSACHRA